MVQRLSIFAALMLLVSLSGSSAVSMQHQEQQSKKKKKGAGAMLLEKMYNFVQTKGQIGLSPPEKAEVAEIRSILMMDIMPSLFENAEDAQARINQLYQDVMDCQIKVTTGLEINKAMWEDTVMKKRDALECFYKDKLIIDEEEEVCTKYERIKQIMKPPALPPLDHDDNSEAYKYLRDLSNFFCQVPKEFKHTWEECKTLKKNHTERFHFCQDYEEEYERTICGWDIELVETCDEYYGCWEVATKAYHDAVHDLTGLQQGWEEEMDAVSKLDCLWQTWNLSSDPCVVNMTEVYECEEKPINYSNVTLIIYDLPKPKSCAPDPNDPDTADMGVISKVEGIPLPCDDAFFNVNLDYVGLTGRDRLEIMDGCTACPDPQTRPKTTEDPCEKPNLIQENTKCKFQHEDRLFRKEGETLASCFEWCQKTEGCLHFSFGTEDAGQYAGVCMGCVASTKQGHTGFNFYDMPCMDPEVLRYECGDCSGHGGEEATGGWDQDGHGELKAVPMYFCNDGSRFLNCDASIR